MVLVNDRFGVATIFLEFSTIFLIFIIDLA